MAKFRITGPDGNTYEITAPDDATEEQVLAYAQTQQAPTKQRSPQELQNAVMRGEPGAKEEWDARVTATQGAAGLKPYSPTEGQRGTDLRVEGFGRSINSTKEGIGQLLGITPQSQIDESARIDAPLMGDTNGQIGNIAGLTTQMLIPGTALARTATLAPKLAALPAYARFGAGLLGAAGENAAFTGIQPVVSGDTRAGNMGEAALWGAGGKAAQSGVGLLARGGSGVISNTMKNLQEEAAKRGITLGVPELTNNQMVQTVSNQLGRLPFGGGIAKAERNKAAINQAVAKTFGENADAVNSEVYGAAKSRIGGEFNRLTDQNNLPVTRELMSSLKAAQENAGKLSTSGPVVSGWIDELLSKAGADGKIPGKAYQAIDSELGAAMKSGGPEAYQLGKLREVIRGHMDEAISPADKQAWQQARSQYGALKTIRDLVSKDSGEGISPQGLMARVTSNNAGKERMAQGTAGELGLLAQIGQKIKAPPNSGTADRALVNIGAGGLLYGAQNQGYISPELALLMGGGLLGNRALNSRAASNYYAKGLSPVASGLLKGAAKPLPYVLPAIAATSAAAEPKKKKKKKD